jgi:hypothetical protein
MLKTRWLHARLTEAEDDAFQALAKQHGITRSQLIVALVRVAINETPGPLALYTEGLEDLIFQVRKIGLNINQIAHAANRREQNIVVDTAVLDEVHQSVLAVVQWLTLSRDMNKARYVKSDGNGIKIDHTRKKVRLGRGGDQNSGAVRKS